ncbi:Cthe_2314 family HEPN domain-containing protein [Rummeliibacillus pycnus]|uniref:Cthe_2314 family HEPN domain-containing protein n=1 Tax=Rummeliibacillus pycnus TaxID=101070 RepID=UPI000C9B82F6|nr:Cthe_2314 family HEPN domain-containing protein [Rummeliibacillus pycnus]
MEKCENEEVKYLRNKINDISYDEDRFTLMLGSDKYIFGIVSAANDSTPISEIIKYKTIYDTLKDLDSKIKLSFKKAINYTYSANVQKNYSILKTSSEEEVLAYYYIENALFRTISLWDMLGQLYRLFYKIEIPNNEVYYNRIFNPKNNYSEQFKDKSKTIHAYLTQKDDIKVDGEWRGNHRFVNNYRNKMIHRNSPSVAAISDYDVNLKHHPSFLLKRIIEDYYVVSKFLSDILDEIDEEIMKLP